MIHHPFVGIPIYRNPEIYQPTQLPRGSTLNQVAWVSPTGSIRPGRLWAPRWPLPTPLLALRALSRNRKLLTRNMSGKVRKREREREICMYIYILYLYMFICQNRFIRDRCQGMGRLTMSIPGTLSSILTYLDPVSKNYIAVHSKHKLTEKRTRKLLELSRTGM